MSLTIPSLIAPPPPAGNTLTMRRVFRAFRRHFLLFFLTSALVAAIGVLVVMSLKPSYTATATVAIAPQAVDPLAPDASQAPGEVDDSLPATQASEIASRDVAAAVLAQYPPLPASPKFSFAKYICQYTHYDCPGPPLPAAEQEQANIDAFLKSLTVTPELRSLVIDVSVTAPTGPRAAMLADAVASNYQRLSLANQTQNLNQVAAWLDNRTNQLQQRWQDSVLAADQYSVAHGLTQAQQAGTPDPLIDTQIVNTATSLSAAQANLAVAKSRAEALADATRHGRANALLTLPDQPILVAAAGQLMALESQRNQLSGEFGANYPRVQALNQQIAQTEATLNGQTGAALSSISEAEVSAQSEVNELSANLDALKAQAAGQSTAEAEYRSLSDEADSARTVYETFLEHANEVVDRAALLQPPVIFVSHAGVPLRPTFPDKTKLGLGVIVLALAAGAAAAFARDHFSDGFDEAEVLRAHAQEPILATLPWLPNPRPKKIARHILDEPFSQTGDAVRGLAAKLSLLAPDAHAPRSILVTSASPLEGKSTLALWLVMTMRQGGHDVLLIDGDHRRGSLLSGATSQGKPGFTDYLAGGVRAADLIQKDTATGIDFIPSGNAMSRPFGPDEIDRLRELLMAMKQTYKIVVIDSPPLLAIADGFVHASVVDQTVFVCRWQQTSRRAVTASLDRLRQYGARVAGLVVTMVDPGAVTDFDGLYSRREQYLITQLYGT
jgi:uncharacterized protein involved in exopolysaccharide biosynthesis/Mrp family chromosome partitioning ATPase